MGAEITAPTHAHCGKDRNIVCIGCAGREHFRNEADCCACGTEGGNRYRDSFAGSKAKQRLQYELYLIRKIGNEPDALIGCADIARFGAAEGQHHDDGADYEHARNDAYAYLDAAAAACHEAVHNAHAELFLIFGSILFPLADDFRGDEIAFRFGAENLFCFHEHQSCAYNTSDDCAEKTHEHCCAEIAVALTGIAENGGADDEAHAEGGTEVGKSVNLILFEVLAEALIICKREDCRVI